MKQVGMVFLLSLVLGQTVANEVDPETLGKIKKQVETAFPTMVVERVENSPVEGIYQLTSGPNVIYASNNGRYLFTGDVIDLEQANDRNITEKLRRKARSNVLKKIDAKEMVIYKPSEAIQGEVIVFTDSDCGYCKKLHSEIPKLLKLGIQLKYLAYPRQGIGSPTYTKMESVWCAKDRKEAMTRLMKGEEVSPAECQNTLQSQMELARKIGISGTPSLIFRDGTMWGGYVPAERLAKMAIEHNSLKE